MSDARRAYPSDLSDAEWASLAPPLAAPAAVGSLPLDAGANAAYLPPT